MKYYVFHVLDFGLYEAATFGLIGVVSAMQGWIIFISQWEYWMFLFYFLIPANILIYGVNDMFDYETDKLNPKKGTYEALVTPEKNKMLWIWIAVTNIPFFFFVLLSARESMISFIRFSFLCILLFGTSYTCKSTPHH
jgi:4-hydroxybenzoate polyprenyltransferase